MLLGWVARIRIDPRRLLKLRWVHDRARELAEARRRLLGLQNPDDDLPYGHA
ncbi:MAG: hypothetical protein HY553_06345 [Elusimicrobia bacterium]|nr:hypothetical protein [Elusimicrobiota bacterium]